MGCVSSSATGEKDGENTPEIVTNGNPKDDKQVARQRRRLSVAPNQVGDITKAVNAATEKKDLTLTQDEEAARGSMRTSALSQKGYVPYNKKKVNQDRAIIKYALKDDVDISLFGVFDGHGEVGHLVSQFVIDQLPIFLAKETNLKTKPDECITRACANMCAQLEKENINIAFSGTTAVFGLRIGNTLKIANIGDSRCVLGRKSPKKPEGYEAIPLSFDHKPENPGEYQRIINAGGRVQTLPGPPDVDCGPMRVWLAEVDVPGLAMSRSIGDQVSQSVGVVSIPEIITHELDEDADVFCIWASDGVWEFMDDQSAVDLVHKYQSNLQLAAKKLVQESTDLWRREEEVIDDITCVILEFNHPEKKVDQPPSA